MDHSERRRGARGMRRGRDSARDHQPPKARSHDSASDEHQAQQRTQVADELSFAECMRSHGQTSFPDPTAHGLTLEMIEAQGIDLHSPAVLRVVQACLPASHGALTPAKVREALSDAGG